MKYRALQPSVAAPLFYLLLSVFTWFSGNDAACAATRTLTIHSGPQIGVPIIYSADGGATETVTTTTTKNLEKGSTVTLTAPEQDQHRPFLAWWINGFNHYSNERTIQFDLNESTTFIAVFDVPEYKLEVTSSPDVGIEILNEDIVSRFTPFERDFITEEFYEVILNAPVIFNAKPFSRWVVNGEEVSTLHVINIIMDDDYTVEAQYGSGSIKCKIQPRAARKKKAKWRIDGGPWLKRGATVEGLRVGNHTLEWKPISGFTTPNPRVVPIEDGDQHTIRGRYFPLK